MENYKEQDKITKQLLQEYNLHVNMLAIEIKNLLTIDTINLKIIEKVDEVNLPIITKYFKEIRVLAESMFKSYTLANELYRDEVA